MTLSMIACPACRTMLFTDTVVCPACKHVLDTERSKYVEGGDESSKSRTEQIPCRSCGEANQIGLVRCWNCSTFLREDIQEAYFEMLRADREITYSQPGAQIQDSGVHSPPPAESDDYLEVDDDLDFELDEGYSFSEQASEETYQLSQPEPTPQSNEEETAETPAASEESTTEDEKPKRRPVVDDPDAEDHSVATGGDVLFDIAVQEEQEEEAQRKKHAAKRKKAARRKQGASPQSAAQKKTVARKKVAKKAAKKKVLAKYGIWFSDAKYHFINPQKLKLKPGSVESQFEPRDVAFSKVGMIVMSLAKKAGLFGKAKETPEEVRQATREHLEAGKKLDELPAPEHHYFEDVQLKDIKVVQPVVYVHESMFSGMPIFGEGRVAVMLPATGEGPEQAFLSFFLSEFRRFASVLAQRFQIKDLGLLEGVPLTDPILKLTCHYSDEVMEVLDPEAIKFYEADPNLAVELVGRRCEGCGLAISEDARRKEKIGGLNGKSIAKTKCPKCEKKFGNTSLYRLTKPPATS